jgi:hypothetical protein
MRCIWHLEYRLAQEGFASRPSREERALRCFADDTANWLTRDMDDEINGFSNLGFGVGEGRNSQNLLRVAQR